ncbi:hypothetical protein J3456_13735 [Sulfitobacter sp. NFXS29]|uniref:hypothetical protein n=1 Tax=Sulfitobacter sp. NFXS29 TaxID=2818438 RepID=UPI0032E03A33
MIIRFKSIAAVSVVVASLGNGAHAEIVMFGQSSRTLVLSNAELTQSQAAGFRKFARKSQHFGAFAVSQSTGRWDFYRGYNDLKQVQALTVGKCNIMGKTDDCEIYAIATAASLPVNAQSAKGLSGEQQAYLEETYLPKTRSYPRKFAAFVVNGSFHIGRWGRSYKETAISDAISACKRYGARLKGTDPAGVYALRKKLGLLECHLIDVRRHSDLIK